MILASTPLAGFQPATEDSKYTILFKFDLSIFTFDQIGKWADVVIIGQIAYFIHPNFGIFSLQMVFLTKWKHIVACD
jgi:hypothetical protein